MDKMVYIPRNVIFVGLIASPLLACVAGYIFGRQVIIDDLSIKSVWQKNNQTITHYPDFSTELSKDIFCEDSCSDRMLYIKPIQP